jgi:hypothetical protein
MRRSRLSAFALLVPTCALAASCTGDDTAGPPPPAADAGTTVDGSTVVDAAAGIPLWDGSPVAPYEASTTTPVARVGVTSEMVATKVDSLGMFFSSGEMQITGEPFAEFFGGRNLAYYDRTFLPPNEYLIPTSGNNDAGVFDTAVGGDVIPTKDLFGFSTAVESYEYSKYHMNSIIEWGSAGLSLVNGPVLATRPGAALEDKLIARADALLTTTGTDVGGYAILPPPVGNPLNVLGFAGLTPVFAPYSSFEPAIAGTLGVIQSCARSGGYGGIPTLGQVIPEYECEYNELHVPDSAVDHVLVPAVLGFGAWKQALWAIDFAGRIHDSGSNQVNAINPADQPLVGTANNSVVATDPPGAAVGTYVGSTPLEGMWGIIMTEGMDNLAEMMTSSLMTSDGVTLTGFPSTLAAITYDYTSPLQWFPAATSVTVDATQTFPPLTGMAITDGTSRTIDLAALLLGFSNFFAMTDSRNAGIGQRIGFQVLFDGNHVFAADDGLPDGEASAHDRALGVARVAFVDLDRIHADPTLGVFNDTATISGATITRSNTVTTSVLAHALIGMREAVLSLDAASTQYGAADEDPTADAQGILNTVPIAPPSGGNPPFCTYVRSVFTKNAAFVRDVLTTSTGQVYNGATIANGVATAVTGAATLQSQASAARALTEAYLLTSDSTFLDRARLVVTHMFSAFFSQPALMFRELEGGPDQVHMTPELFGWLESSLRETDKTLYVDGDPVLGRPALEPVIARIVKLYLDGWDDINGNMEVDHGDGGAPQECLTARMQQAEQSLTGELGRDQFGLPTPDRDSDCVTELGHAMSLSVFAGEVLFHSP